ncbi:hypothetical protein Tco_0097870 [Tanacetum coccineum]
MLSDIEYSHGPSGAIHNPSQPLKVEKTLFQNSQRFTHFYQLSHSELVDIEKVAFSSSLRSLKSKYTIEFNTIAGNPVKEFLLKLNLPDHRLILTDSKIMSPRMTTRSAGRSTVAPRGGRTGGRVGRGVRRTRPTVRKNNETIGKLDGQGNDRGFEANGGVGGVLDFSIIIAQQLQNLLPTLLAQIGNKGNNQGNNRNQNGDAVNDNIQDDVRNVIMNND